MAFKRPFWGWTSIAVLCFFSVSLPCWPADLHRIATSLERKRSEIQKVDQELAGRTDSATRTVRLLEKRRRLLQEMELLQKVNSQSFEDQSKK